MKTVFRAVFLLIALPLAALCAFGKLKAVYTVFAHAAALAPGIVGDYFRIAFYRLTLAECSMSNCVSFGSFFAHPETRLGHRIYIGPYTVIGNAVIGDRTQIATGVQILSGARQHARDADGRISGAERGQFASVSIGSDCWIGAAAVVMADVGSGSTIGAGSVVPRPIPPNSVAVGNPARVIRSAAGPISAPPAHTC